MVCISILYFRSKVAFPASLAECVLAGHHYRLVPPGDGGQTNVALKMVNTMSVDGEQRYEFTVMSGVTSRSSTASGEALESTELPCCSTDVGAWTPAIWQHSIGSLIHFSRSTSRDHSGKENLIVVLIRSVQ